MEAGIGQPAGVRGGVAVVGVRRHGRARQYQQRVQQGHDDGGFHPAGIYFFAQKLGRAAHHEAGDEYGQRQDKKSNHHGETGLDVVEKIDGFIEKPEARQASGNEQRNH